MCDFVVLQSFVHLKERIKHSTKLEHHGTKMEIIYRHLEKNGNCRPDVGYRVCRVTDRVSLGFDAGLCGAHTGGMLIVLPKKFQPNLDCIYRCRRLQLARYDWRVRNMRATNDGNADGVVDD